MVYEMKVSDVMTRDVITVGLKERMGSLGEILCRNRISGLPVIEGDRLVGLVSIEDYIKWMDNKQENCAVKDRMTSKVATLYDDAPLVLAIRRFERTGMGRFPVVDRKREELVGILTKGDVIEGLLNKLEIDYHHEETQRPPAKYIFDNIEADNVALLFGYDVKGQDFAQAGESSSRLKKTLSHLGIQPAIVRRIAVASYEAELNLIVFTEGGRIHAEVKPTRVFIEVEDSGPGISDIKKALEPGYSTAPDWVRELGFGAGMGLANIQKTADEFDIQSEPGKGTLLNISFFINNEESREAC